MQVRVYATLRPIVGGAVAEMETGPGDTFCQLLDEMITLAGDKARALPIATASFITTFTSFSTAAMPAILDGLDMPIPEDGQVRIFPPVGGGQISTVGESIFVQVTHDYHGVPLWLMKEYLVDLGAEEVETDSMVGVRLRR